jgi:peroxin-5
LLLDLVPAKDRCEPLYRPRDCSYLGSLMNRLLLSTDFFTLIIDCPATQKENKMAFQSMLSGAECSTGNNALSQMLKHTNGDRSLQQGDRTNAGPSFQGPASIRQGVPNGNNPEAEAFFRQQQNQQRNFAQSQGGSAYDFEQMKNEMNRINEARSAAGGGGGSNVWADEMARLGIHPGQGPQMIPPEVLRQMGIGSGGGGPNMSEMEAVYAGSGGGGADSAQAHAWRQQYGTHTPLQQQTSASRGDNGGASYASRGGSYGMNGMGMMGGMSGMGMGMGMGGGMSSMYNRAPLSSANKTSTQQSSRFVELDDAKWEEQFAKLDDASSATEIGKGKGKASEDGLPSQEEQDAAIRRELDELEKDVSAEGTQSQKRFEELWNAMNAGNAVDPDLAEWERELNDARTKVEDEMYQHPGGGIGMGEAARREVAGLDGTEDALLDGFGTISADGYPRLGSYRFDNRNPFVTHPDPLSEGLRLLGSGGSLADAALLFEVATQRDAVGGTGGEQNEVDVQRRSKSEAWRRLGEAQAMNERETQAIRALEEAIKIDEGNLEAYMALAISYTNEGYDSAAHSTLERYMQRAYPQIKPEPLPASISGAKDPIDGSMSATGENPWASLNRVTSLFLQAAREGNATGRIDPEVQVGLGVLFYSNSSYDQARDCFEAALQARPNDFLLWNRLGATLANGGKPEEAIEAYHKALELRPTFTRAIYNLSVSCLNLGAHHEAAEHLLAALSLQATHTLPDIPAEVNDGQFRPSPLAEVQESSNLWSTLRRIFLCMDRMDLAQHAHVGSDLSQFRKEGFEF